MHHCSAVEDIRISVALTDCLDRLRHFLVNRRQQFLLFLLDILLCRLIEELDTLVHLLQFLLTNLLDSISHRSLLRLIVLHFLLDLLVHRSQLALILRLDSIHFGTYLCHLGHLREELLSVNVTEFLCAGKHWQSQQHCNNNLFHFAPNLCNT